ncbi:Cysteine-rich secretory protein family protein [Streptomyces griseofuscus]|uniref:Cysteine-rich secretory protein family protein n=1 Tax=Streptomyces griseofuscus TaxID=146922 RepID=A0A7H1PVL0_9ACTN|nr:CAP domain-containing protein [Streptomyces griseofuscus]QNT92090.1 Cysteine-rich secretory protein family protein [Streptomyces griseofuscus]
MGKHRKTQYFRRMVIGAVAVGTVGVPSVALACTDWPSGATDQSAAATGATALALADIPAPTDTATAGQTAIPQQPGRARAIPKQRAHHHPRHLPEAPGAPLTTAAPAAPQTATAQPGGAPSAAQPEQTDAPAPAPTASSTPTPAATATTASGVTAQIVQLVNAERAKAGCQPLTLNAKLTKAAQEHSADMAAHQNMSHTGSDGSDPGTRITQAGYTWSAYGENVAYGYSTAAEVMAGWMSSPGHRANILNCGYQEIGVGLAQPDSYWTQDFGTAR